MKRLVRNLVRGLGYEVKRVSRSEYSDSNSLAKAEMFIERYREIVSDPLNLLIHRVPEAGYVDGEGCVILHNGNRVPIVGPFAYYSNFSDILIINRGVHEPLEEFCFQAMLSRVETATPTMIELGAYWAHYSMWLKKIRPKAECYMVEPDRNGLECGKNNFSLNKYDGIFISARVGSSGFQLDAFLSDRGIASLDILHSDIQGHELEMLEGARALLSEARASYVFISTHSENLHLSVVRRLREYSYRVEVSSGFDEHTTSCDGFVLATSPKLNPLFKSFSPLGRVQIARSQPHQLLASISSIQL